MPTNENPSACLSGPPVIPPPEAASLGEAPAPRAAGRCRGAVRYTLQMVVGAYIVLASAAPYRYGRLMGIALAVCLFVALVRGCLLPIRAVYWAGALAIVGACALLNGVIRGHHGALAMAGVFTVEPLLLGLLLPMLYRARQDLELLLKTLDVALVAVFTVGLLLYFAEKTGIHLPLDPLLDERFTTVDVSATSIRTNYQGFNSLIFLVPYGLLRAFTITPRSRRQLAQRAILVASGVGGALLAGRTILFLSSPTAIGLVLLWDFHRRKRDHDAQRPRHSRILRFAIGTGGAFVALGAVGVSAETAISSALSEITLKDESGIRPLQSRLLLDRFAESPLIGHGAGTTIEGYARNPDAPWQFELSYHVILVTFGLVGATVFAFWNASMLRHLLRGLPSHPEGGWLAGGLMGALLAAATNPYLFKMDGIWMLFVPFAAALWRRTELRCHELGEGRA